MLFKLILCLGISLTLSACSYNHKQEEVNSPPLAVKAKTYRDKSVNVFADVHSTVRHMENQTYNILYFIRDEFDSFIYDVRKDYYERSGIY